MTTQILQKWNRVKLGDVAKIESGGTPSSAKSECWDGGDIYWATLPDLKSKYIFDTQRKITPLGLKNSSAKILPINSVIFSSRATIGEVSITKVETSTNQGSKNFICNPEKLDYEFLYYLLKSKAEEIKQLASGATYKEINKTVFSLVEVDLPDVEQQKNIASILSVYDDMIENNTRRIKILEQMAQRIYTEWFVNFRFPGYEKIKMVDSGTDFGKIPEEWKIGIVGEVFKFLGGGTPSKKKSFFWDNGEINWFTPSDLTKANNLFATSSSAKITNEGLDNSSAKMFPAYSVMMTSRATLGVISINTVAATTNQGFIVCVPNENYPLWLLYFWLKQNEDNFSRLATGATFKEITKGVFRTIKLVLPKREIVSEFQRAVDIIMQQVLNLQLRNENLRQTRDFLLPKLVNEGIKL